MKFLVSPSFRYSGRLRALLLALLSLLFLFNLIHARNFCVESGLWDALQQERENPGDVNADPSSIGLTETGEEDENTELEPSAQAQESTGLVSWRLALLEDFHIDLFVFSLEYLLLVALFLQSGSRKALQQAAVHGLPVLLLFWLVLRLVLRKADGVFEYPVFLAGVSVVFYTGFQALVFFLFIRLALTRKKTKRDVILE